MYDKWMCQSNTNVKSILDKSNDRVMFSCNIAVHLSPGPSQIL